MFGLLAVIVVASFIVVVIHDTKKQRQKEDCNKATDSAYTSSSGGRITLDNGRITISDFPLDKH